MPIDSGARLEIIRLREMIKEMESKTKKKKKKKGRKN